MIGERLRIAPPGTMVPDDGRLVIRMARGAFGSGEHETTESCLAVLETLPLRGARILDVGSGTGILAIAAVLLGAEHAVCLDTSARAVAAARENGELNHVGARLAHVCGQLADLPGAQVDVVVANLYGDLILDLAPELVKRVAPSGVLLLSGILWEYRFDIIRRLERLGAVLSESHMLSEFTTLQFAPPGAA